MTSGIHPIEAAVFSLVVCERSDASSWDSLERAARVIVGRGSRVNELTTDGFTLPQFEVVKMHGCDVVQTGRGMVVVLWVGEMLVAIERAVVRPRSTVHGFDVLHFNRIWIFMA